MQQLRAAPAAASIGPAGATALVRFNPPGIPIRLVIQRLWEAIDRRDDWQPLQDWLSDVQGGDDLAQL
jgi:hypothetical protein